MMTKRFLSLLLALVTVLSLTAPALAANTAASGTCGAQLTWSLSSAGVLTVSGSGAMENYEIFDAPWYDYSQDIKKIVVKNGVTGIGDYAFYLCCDAGSVTLPDSVTYIGDSAFSSCGMADISLPAKLSYLGPFAFAWCPDLKSIRVPDEVTALGDRAFAACESLTSVTLPEGLVSIGDGVFSNCSRLTEIAIPNRVTSIGGYVFSNCSSLTDIQVAGGNKHYASVNGALLNAEKTELLYCPGGKTSYTVPDGVTSIGDSAFIDCGKLSAVTLPEGLRSIGTCAFFLCGKLSKVVIPDSVTSIGESAFSECTALSQVSIGSGVKMIAGYAFYDCSGLKSITIPANVTDISEYAFGGCTSLKSLSVLNPDCRISSTEQTLGSPDVTVISGYTGSTAETYAGKFGYSFKRLDVNLATPANLKAVNVSGGIRVSWDPVPGAAQYRLFYIKNGKWAKLRDTADTSVTLKSDKVGKTYTYTVRCLSADGKSYESAYDKAGVSVVLGKLDTPSNLKAVNVPGGIQVSWSKVSGAEMYRLFYIKNGKWTKLRDTADTSVTLKSDKLGKTYTYTVRCLSADGKSYTSSYDKTGVSVVLGRLDTPSNLRAVNVSGGIQVSWDPVPGAEQYRLFYIKDGKWVKLRDTTGTSVTLKSDKVGKTYTYTVRCVSADGKSYTSSYDKTGVSVIKE